MRREERKIKRKEEVGMGEGRRRKGKWRKRKGRKRTNQKCFWCVCVCVCVCFKGMKRYWRWELRDYIKRAQKSRKEKTPGKIEEQAGSTREREVKQK